MVKVPVKWTDFYAWSKRVNWYLLSSDFLISHYEHNFITPNGVMVLVQVDNKGEVKGIKTILK